MLNNSYIEAIEKEMARQEEFNKKFYTMDSSVHLLIYKRALDCGDLIEEINKLKLNIIASFLIEMQG